MVFSGSHSAFGSHLWRAALSVAVSRVGLGLGERGGGDPVRVLVRRDLNAPAVRTTQSGD